MNEDFIYRVRNEFLDIASIEVATWIACQFALESDFGSSNLAMNYYNYCGMKLPFKRLTTGRMIIDSDFAKYSCLDDCILDYKLWLAYNKFRNKDLQNISLFFPRLVNCGYCPENDYIDKVNSIYYQFKTIKNG